MSEIFGMDLVEKAANRLRYHGPRGWQEKIDVDELNLDNGTKCVLGQIYGTYNNYEAEKFRNAECSSCPDWGTVNRAFNDAEYTDAWKEFLRPGSSNAIKAEDVGKVWYAKPQQSSETVTLLASYVHNGDRRVVYAYPSSARHDRSETHFLGYWQREAPKPKYVVGGLYTPKDGPSEYKSGSNSRLILLCVGPNKFQALAAGGDLTEDGDFITQTSDASWWTQKHGELIPVKYAAADTINRGQQIVVNLNG